MILLVYLSIFHNQIQLQIFVLSIKYESVVTLLPTLTFLTNSVKQSSSWEAHIRSANQDTPRHVWNPNVCYCVHKSRLLLVITSQMNPVHTLTARFKIRLNIIIIILPYMPVSPK
jgi:hypothetical protein